jgi:hypothetical protein
MYQRYRERFGTAGVVVGVIALVLALVTGAYAAGGGLSGKQKKEVEKIAKKFAGKDGTPGAAGTNGTNGTNGKDGAPGEKGAKGDTGEAGVCSETNPTCVAPHGVTFTGTWGTAGGNAEQPFSMVPISFPLQLAAAPTAVTTAESPDESTTIGVVLKDGSGELYDPAGNLDFGEMHEEWEDICPGSAAAPAAEPGFLCIYTKEIHLASEPVPLNAFAAKFEAAHRFGVVVPFKINSKEGYARGSWAVTTE